MVKLDILYVVTHLTLCSLCLFHSLLELPVSAVCVCLRIEKNTQRRVDNSSVLLTEGKWRNWHCIAFLFLKNMFDILYFWLKQDIGKAHNEVCSRNTK